MQQEHLKRVMNPEEERLLVVAMPRAGVRAFAAMAGVHGEDASAELRRAMEAGEEPPAGRYRASFFGQRYGTEGRRCWEWWLSAPGARIVFLTRKLDEDYELSVEFTALKWLGEGLYGKCIQRVWRKITLLEQQILGFEHPRAVRISLAEFSDFEAVERAVGREVDPVLWERLNRERPGRWKLESRAEPEGPGEIPEDFDPFEGADEDEDPFAEDMEQAAREEERRDFLRRFKQRRARPFLRMDPWHELAIAIPYLAGADAWDELRYVLRSIHLYFEDKECPIYLLGNAPPPWLEKGGRVRWIPIPSDARRGSDGFFDARVIGYQVAKRVLWFNDDIVLLRPQGWKDFEVALFDADISWDHGMFRSKRAWYKGMTMAAMQLIRLRPEQPVLRFATHTPVLYEVEKVREILSRFYIFKRGSFAILYHNWFQTKRAPVGRARTSWLPGRAGARFLNFKAEGPDFESRVRLAEMFVDPAPWEKVSAPAVVFGAIRGELPHLSCFLEKNPEAEWYVDPQPVPSGRREKIHLWRTPDRRMVAWWAVHRDKVSAERIAFVEADVRIDATLEQAFPVGGGAEVAETVKASADWPWWAEKDLIPEDLKPFTSGVMALAVVVFHRSVLDKLVGMQDLAPDLFSELRLPTLCRKAGTPMRMLGSLANVHPNACLSVKTGVSHPVKSSDRVTRVEDLPADKVLPSGWKGEVWSASAVEEMEKEPPVAHVLGLAERPRDEARCIGDLGGIGIRGEVFAGVWSGDRGLVLPMEVDWKSFRRRYRRMPTPGEVGVYASNVRFAERAAGLKPVHSLYGDWRLLIEDDVRFEKGFDAAVLLELLEMAESGGWDCVMIGGGHGRAKRAPVYGLSEASTKRGMSNQANLWRVSALEKMKEWRMTEPIDAQIIKSSLKVAQMWGPAGVYQVGINHGGTIGQERVAERSGKVARGDRFLIITKNGGEGARELYENLENLGQRVDMVVDERGAPGIWVDDLMAAEYGKVDIFRGGAPSAWGRAFAYLKRCPEPSRRVWFVEHDVAADPASLQGLIEWTAEQDLDYACLRWMTPASHPHWDWWSLAKPFKVKRGSWNQICCVSWDLVEAVHAWEFEGHDPAFLEVMLPSLAASRGMKVVDWLASPAAKYFGHWDWRVPPAEGDEAGLRHPVKRL